MERIRMLAIKTPQNGFTDHQGICFNSEVSKSYAKAKLFPIKLAYKGVVFY